MNKSKNIQNTKDSKHEGNINNRGNMQNQKLRNIRTHSGNINDARDRNKTGKLQDPRLQKVLKKRKKQDS